MLLYLQSIYATWNGFWRSIESKDLNKISCWDIINWDMLSFVSLCVLESMPKVSLRLLHVRIDSFCLFSEYIYILSPYSETILFAENNPEYDIFSLYSTYILWMHYYTWVIYGDIDFKLSLVSELYNNVYGDWKRSRWQRDAPPYMRYRQLPALESLSGCS